ncbi:MAG TPA: hypothetical protein DCR46_08530 [Cytophagales bacterium]|jgi:hypothetical protein|nr:hypothetical protein [Cytophagales bacterium]
MNSSEKKALILLKAIIFLHHDFTDEEKKVLAQKADTLDAHEELNWVMNFVQEDTYTAYERTRAFLKNALDHVETLQKVAYLCEVWSATNQKGFITEMEAMSMIKLARDWGVESEFIKQVRKK